MSESLWEQSAGTLLDETASAAPTPGGGAIAALTAAFGLGLLEMAIAVSLGGMAAGASASSGPSGPSGSSGSGGSGDGDRARLDDAATRARALRSTAAAGADRDVADFEALMAGYRMPRGTEDQRAARGAAIDAASVIATEGPLELAETALAGIALGEEIAPLVKATILSDVRAGRDLLRGAALAALATADINLLSLEAGGHLGAPSLRARRDAAARSATPAEEPG